MANAPRNRFFFAWDHSGACGHAHKNTTAAAKCARKNGLDFVMRIRTTCADLVRVQDGDADCHWNTAIVWDVVNGCPV